MYPTTIDALPRLRRSAGRLAVIAALSLGAWAAVLGAGSALAAPSGSGEQEAMSDEAIYALTCGHLGISCQTPKPKLTMKVRAGRVVARARTRVLVRVSQVRGGKIMPARGASVQVGGRTVRTDERGHASVVVRYRRGGHKNAVARKAGARSARSTIKVH